MGVDDVTAPQRRVYAKAGLRSSKQESGHVGAYHCRARSGEACV